MAFRYLAAGVASDYRSIVRFRRRHLEARAGLFLQPDRVSGRRRCRAVRMNAEPVDSVVAHD